MAEARRATPALLLLLLVSAAAPVRAAECALPDGAEPALARVDADLRLHFLQQGLRHAARQARIWAWSSAGALVFAASVQLLGATHVPDAGDRADLWVGAASVGFSLAQLALFYPRVTIDQWTLDRHVARAGPHGDRCALVAEAEALLVRDARSEAIATSAAMQAVTFLFNIGTGLVLGIGFDRWHSAAINLFVGAALGELQIVTQPTESIDLLRRYRAGRLTSPAAAQVALRWRLTPTASPGGCGLLFGASF